MFERIHFAPSLASARSETPVVKMPVTQTALAVFASVVIVCSAGGAFDALTLDLHDLNSLADARPLSAAVLLQQLENAVSGEGTLPQPIDGSASLFWFSRRANLTVLMGTSREPEPHSAATAGPGLRFVSKRLPIDISTLDVADSELGRRGSGRMAATWATIPRSESSSMYGVAMTSVPVRGLLIAWADAARQPLLIVAPDLLPPGCEEASAHAHYAALLHAEAKLHSEWRISRGATAKAAAATPARARGSAAGVSATAATTVAAVCELPGMPETRSILSSVPAGQQRRREARIIMQQELALAALSPYRTAHPARSPPRALLAEVEKLALLPPATARALAAAAGAHPLRRALYGHEHHDHHDDASAAVAPTGSATSDSNGSGPSTVARRVRQLFINPVISRGTRHILAVRFVFNGQAATAVGSDAVLRPMLTDAVAELNKAAMGAAAFDFVMPTNTFVYSSTTPTCTTNYGLLESDARTVVQATAGIDTTTYTHFMILLSSCNFVWAGLGNVAGGTTWINGPTAQFQNVVIHEMGHNLGLGHASSRDPLMGTFVEYSNEYDYMVRGLLQSPLRLLTFSCSAGRSLYLTPSSALVVFTFPSLPFLRPCRRPVATTSPLAPSARAMAWTWAGCPSPAFSRSAPTLQRATPAAGLSFWAASTRVPQAATPLQTHRWACGSGGRARLMRGRGRSMST